MKLSKESAEKFISILQTASIAGIEKLIIENKQIRGTSENNSIVVLSKENVPDFGNLTVGMNRIGVLTSRLNLLKSTGEFTIEAIEAKNKTEVSHLHLKSDNTSVQYRCASSEAIQKIPKIINDKLCWLIEIPGKAISLVTMGIAAMASENLIFSCKKKGTVDGVYFEAIDTDTNDIFSTCFTETLTWIPEENKEPSNKSFSHTYPFKILIPLLKTASNNGTEPVNVMIGEKGILTVIVNSYDFFVVPQI